MPIYEFVCEKCSAEFEQLFKSSLDNEAVQCPECGSENTRKKFSTFATAESVSNDPPPNCASCPNMSCEARN